MLCGGVNITTLRPRKFFVLASWLLTHIDEMLYGGVNIMTLQSASAGHKMKRPVAYTLGPAGGWLAAIR